MASSVSIAGVSKTYGTLRALEPFSLEVERGSIFGLLGPNGAGKTTLIKILTTLMRPTSGDALVEGHSITRNGKKVREMIGVVPQENNLDRYLTARENLVLHARMHGLAPSMYNPRIDELLELTGLANRQKDFPDTFSGGMQRRLVAARALVHNPRVLFLDEPTTGLDPQSRRALWDYIDTLRATMTIFLTTHYMDEADALCDRIVIMDGGKVLVDGDAATLKKAKTEARIYVVEFRENAESYEEMLKGLPYVEGLERRGGIFRLSLAGEEFVRPLMEAIGSSDVRKICLVEPTLEDVFIDLTGKKIRD
jgi:ABC-2 type transport system ATP-binding protein